jgi:hypothetical protein
VRRVLAKEFLDRIDIFGRGSAPLIFSKDDVLQLPQIVQERTFIISPLGFVGIFRLEPPDATELRHADFALSAFGVFLLPYVLTPHPTGILH